MEMKLIDQIAIVTGAGSGIGAATAMLFAAEGARVVIVDEDAAGAARTAAAIVSAEGTAQTHVADAADAAAVERIVGATMQAFGRIDILVTSAAISVGGTVTTVSEADWDRLFRVNVKAVFLWCRAVIPPMAARGKGSIVTLGSQLAIASLGNSAPYIASKGAIVSLTKTMAVDYARDGIRVNALMPGAIDTPFLQRSMARQADPQASAERSRKRHAMGRFGRAEEVARAALFLASDDASFTTGSLLFVDGGWTAM
jgi:NAD(P)-dependent dehydrogenase (short-subunit alcohol dehydrogenase family)